MDNLGIGEDTRLHTAPIGARFRQADHTAKVHQDELWWPTFLDSRPPLAWQHDPSDIIARAGVRALELAATADNQYPLN